MMRLNPITFNIQDTNEIKRYGSLELVKALTKFLGIGGFYAEEILVRAKIEKNTPCEDLTEPQMGELFEQLQQIILPVKSGNLQPCVIIGKNGELVDAVPIAMKKSTMKRSSKAMNM